MWGYGDVMTRTHEIVPRLPNGDQDAEGTRACGMSTEAALQMLEGRWKTAVLARLFDRPVLRFSELRRAIGGVSAKMLTEQLRELERDGLVRRTVYPEIPPRVEYELTDDGRGLLPALTALRAWAEARAARQPLVP